MAGCPRPRECTRRRPTPREGESLAQWVKRLPPGSKITKVEVPTMRLYLPPDIPAKVAELPPHLQAVAKKLLLAKVRRVREASVSGAVPMPASRLLHHEPEAQE